MSGRDYPGLREWRLRGERGISSEAIADRLEYGETRERWGDYPHDPDDFRRCELLLRCAPSMRADLHLMADQGPEWAALVGEWATIAAMIEADAPGVFTGSRRGGSYRAYAYMEKIMHGRDAIPGMGDRVKIGRRGRTVWMVVEVTRGRSAIPLGLVLRSERGTIRRVEGNDMSDLWRFRGAS